MLRLAASSEGGAPKRARVPSEPEVLPLPAETSREAPECCAWQHQEGGPETRSGTVQSLKCCPCQQKRAARLPSAAPGSIKGGGPETRSGTVQSLKCCPCQQKRAARLPNAAPGSIKEGGGAPKRARVPSRASGCPCQQKRAARLPSAAPGSIKSRPRNALGYRPEPEVLPCLRLAASSEGGAPKRARYLPAESSREAPKCCAWQHQGYRLCQQKRAEVLRLAASRGGGPETRSGTVQSLKCCPCQQKRAARLPSAASRGAPRNALGHRPEPEVLPLPAETSREAPKCCAWQHQGGGGAKPSAAPGRGGAPKRAVVPSRA